MPVLELGKQDTTCVFIRKLHMFLGDGDEFGQVMEIYSNFKDLPILVLTLLPKETGKPNSGRHFTMKCTPQEKMATCSEFSKF